MTKLTDGNDARKNCRLVESAPFYAFLIEPHHSQSGSLGYSEKFNFDVKKLNSPRLPIMHGFIFSESSNTLSDSKTTNDAEIPANGAKFPIFLFSLCNFLVFKKSIGSSFSSPNLMQRKHADIPGRIVGPIKLRWRLYPPEIM